MRTDMIQPGRYYTARVSNSIVPIQCLRVNSVETPTRKRGARFLCQNLRSGRELLLTAARIRDIAPAGAEAPCLSQFQTELQVGDRCRLELDGGTRYGTVLALYSMKGDLCAAVTWDDGSFSIRVQTYLLAPTVFQKGKGK